MKLYTNLNTAITALFVIMALNFVFLVCIYGIKLRNIKRRRLLDRFQGKLRDYLTYVQANLDGGEPLRAPPWTMNRVEEKAMQERLNDMIECFSGEQRHKLLRLCEELGFVKHHLARLHSRSYRVKLDAAYHLGCMRVKEAAPALLELLKGHPLNSALFVVARALAKCARNEQDIRGMVRMLLQHNRKYDELIVSILADSELETASLFAEYVSQEQPAYIRVGLTGLKDGPDPSAAAAVHRLMDSEHEDIRVKAVEVYLKSSRLLPKPILGKLLSQPNFEIRRLAIEAMAGFKNAAYVELMTAGLADSDPRVVHACAIGMMRMGEGGVAALCQRAAADRGTERGTFIQQLIEEELGRLSTQLHHVDKITLYNTLMYNYDKTVRSHTRIYRVV